MKQLLYSILILILFSCSKDEPEKINTPPKAFEVTAKVEGTNVTLTWTDAVDEDGDAVTYAVVYGADTLAKGLTTRGFTIKDLPYETEISGTVMASDGKGGKIGSGFNTKTGTEPWDDRYVKIPDVEFEKLLINRKIDDIIDGKLLKSEALKVGVLSIVNFNLIQDLAGLEAFENLTILGISSTNISNVDFSSNEKLIDLGLNNNENLENVSFGNLSKITRLSIVKSNIKNLDVTKLVNLEVLGIDYSKIEALDVSKNLRLKEFSVNGNLLSVLDVSQNLKLEKLFCADNILKNLDFTNHKELKILSAGNSKLTSLKLPKNGKLEILRISKSALTTYYLLGLDLTDQYSLKELEFRNSNLGIEPLYLAYNLTSLDLSNNKIMLLDLSLANKLRYLSISDNDLSRLDLKRAKSLEYLDCRGNNRMTEICISKDMTPTENWKKDATATYKVCN